MNAQTYWTRQATPVMVYLAKDMMAMNEYVSWTIYEITRWWLAKKKIWFILFHAIYMLHHKNKLPYRYPMKSRCSGTCLPCNPEHSDSYIPQPYTASLHCMLSVSHINSSWGSNLPLRWAVLCQGLVGKQWWKDCFPLGLMGMATDRQTDS